MKNFLQIFEQSVRQPVMQDRKVGVVQSKTASILLVYFLTQMVVMARFKRLPQLAAQNLHRNDGKTLLENQSDQTGVKLIVMEFPL